ncbi:MAG TPA: ABC transporter ATP-binding protein [Clostridiaceae bacterium]|nr:ABC transporter ATP-binding protein [Clostridiaceae bacterium]
MNHKRRKKKSNIVKTKRIDRKEMPRNNFYNEAFAKTRPQYLATQLISLITHVLSVILALLIQQFIDVGIDQGSNALWGLVPYAVIYLIVNLLANLIEGKVLNCYVKNTMSQLKMTILSRIFKMPMKRYKLNPTGTYISALSNDMNTIDLDYIRGGILTVSKIVMIFTGFALMIYINWILTLIVLFLSLVPVLISSKYNQKLQEQQKTVSKENGVFTSFVKDVLSGYSVINSFNIEEEILNQASTKIDKQEGSKEKYELNFNSLMALTTTSTIAIVLVVFILGAWFTIKGLMTTGSIFAFIQLLNNVTAPINEVITGISKRHAAKGILDKYTQIFDEEEEFQIKEDKGEINSGIKLRNVSFKYEENGENILQNITLDLDSGKQYAVVGLSGSGKSTFLDLISGSYEWYEGDIYLDDIQLREISDESLAELFSHVEQDTFVFDDTIEENIKLYKEWPQDQFEQVLEDACLKEVIKEKGSITARVGEGGGQLSGGEKQRVSIARALLKDSPVLIMDEATSALDKKTSLEVENNISKRKNTLRISITHKLDPEILKNFDAIIMMNNGEITEFGRFDELVNSKGDFYSLYRINELQEDKK